jgi:hypothetical protein
VRGRRGFIAAEATSLHAVTMNFLAAHLATDNFRL